MKTPYDLINILFIPACSLILLPCAIFSKKGSIAFIKWPLVITSIAGVCYGVVDVIIANSEAGSSLGRVAISRLYYIKMFLSGVAIGSNLSSAASGQWSAFSKAKDNMGCPSARKTAPPDPV